MFERYTRSARKAIFFGLWEATQRLSKDIEPQHLLQGIMRAEEVLFAELYSADAVPTLRKRLGYIGCAHCEPPPEKPLWVPWFAWKLAVLLSVDVFKLRLRLADKALSQSSKVALRHAVEEADSLGHQRIENIHLILGLLRETDSDAAEALLSLGKNLETIRLKASLMQ